MAGIRLLVFLVCSCWLPLWANIPGGPIQVTTAASGGDVTVEAVNSRGNRSQCASFGYDVEFGTENQLAAAEYGYDVDYQQAMAAIQALRGVSLCATREATVWASPAEASGEFTGKERDAETGLDYFGARYFSATQGRWTSPDWSASPEPVPYANLSDPQTLNLYSYGRNNPLSNVDSDGHFWQEIANKIRYGMYVDNDHLQDARAEKNKVLLADLDRRGVTVNEKPASEYLKGYSKVATAVYEESLRIEDQLRSQQMERDAEATMAAMAGFRNDFSTKNTQNSSAQFQSEGEARAFARNKLGPNPVKIGEGKFWSQDGKWQYRAKPGDVNDSHAWNV